MATQRALGVRWTIGDVSERGFEALRLSVWGAFRVFGRAASYVVCVNSVPLSRAMALAGELPRSVGWRVCTRDDLGSLAAHFDEHLAEGVGWKLAPLRIFPDRHELALDNDCVLWRLPEAVERWLSDEAPEAFLLAEDARACFGQLAPLCGPEPRNTGLRGLPPGFDLGAALLDVLRERPITLQSELDEQGLQVAALSRDPLHVVALEDVSICSPFPPHRPELGRSGAHFVGLNVKRVAWSVDGRPAEEVMAAHFAQHREALYERVGLPKPQGV